MPIPLNLPPGAPPEPPPKRRSALRRVFRGIGWLSAGPVDWLGVGRIRRGGAFIADLATLLRTGPVRDTKFRTGDDGAFDLQASAFLHGISVEELNRRLRARRRQTARIAYAGFALGCAFLIAWLWQALSSPWTANRVVAAMEFLPFVLLCFLASFQNALLNYQVRVGRLASWWDYLCTTRHFLPR